MKYFLDTEFLEGTQRHRKSFLEALEKGLQEALKLI